MSSGRRPIGSTQSGIGGPTIVMVFNDFGAVAPGFPDPSPGSAGAAPDPRIGGLPGSPGSPGAAGSRRFAPPHPMPRRLTDPADRTPGARLSESVPRGLVGYQIAQASIVIHQVFAAEAGAPFGLRPVEYTVLALIASNPDVTARQLAHALGVTPPNIAVWVDRLDARGLLQRTRSAADARKQHLRVTPDGATLVRDATRRVQAGEAAALSGALTAGEHAILLELLHKVALARRRSGG